jgi:hypothetical protein
MAIAQRTAAELKQLVKVEMEDHGIWAYVQVNPCSGNGWVATVKADPPATSASIRLSLMRSSATCASTTR